MRLKVFCKRTFIYASCLIFSVLCSVSTAELNNLRFVGELVQKPCILDPTTTNINIEFGTVITKFLYTNTRSPAQPFTLRLIKCDTNIGNSVTVSFIGAEDSSLPGFLSIATGDASGIAIGLETIDGKAIPLNVPTDSYKLTNGANEFIIKSFVIGEPDAIANRNISVGTFTAALDFEISYP